MKPEFNYDEFTRQIDSLNLSPDRKCGLRMFGAIVQFAIEQFGDRETFTVGDLITLLQEDVEQAIAEQGGSR